MNTLPLCVERLLKTNIETLDSVEKENLETILK